MKQFIILIVSAFFFLPVKAQDTDSLILEKLNSLQQSLRMYNTQMKKIQEKDFENFRELMEFNDSISQKLVKNDQNIDQTRKVIYKKSEEHSKQIQDQLRTIGKQESTQSVIHYILHVAGILLILFLIWYIRKEKKDNLDYLIKESEKLSVQNDEILDKAKDLSKIKDKLKKILKQQKKIKKKKK